MRYIYAGMAELADALDLESSSQRVQVRFLLSAPSKQNCSNTSLGLFYYRNVVKIKTGCYARENRNSFL